jgi:hypothetical protein
MSRPVNTELSRLEDIVTNHLASFMEMKSPATEELVLDFRAAMAEETERIKSRIMTAVFTADRKKELSRLVQLHQQALIRLVTQLLHYTYPEKIVSGSGPLEPPLLCHYTYKSLDELLNFVERHFTNHFNQDAWVPASYHIIVCHEIRQDFERLEKSLTDYQCEDGQLCHIVLWAFYEFLAAQDTNEITYRKVKYLKALVAELLSVIGEDSGERKTPESADRDALLRSVLIRLNFNSVLFFTNYTNYIAAEVSKAETQGEKLERLSFFLKTINQARDRSGYIYDTKYPSLREQLTGWIVEELNFQEKARQLEITFPQGSGDSPVANARIQMDLSVAHVAALVRGFVETGTIQNKNLSELIRLVSGIIHTKRSETVSAESFRMKYYNMEDSARQAVAKRLKEIAEYLLKS